MKIRIEALFACALICAASLWPAHAGAQTAPGAATPPAAPSASPAAETSAEKEARLKAEELAIIKASQNPVGNIAVLPFQNNWNYGYGPYDRQQFNLNIQPVVPIVLGPKMNLIERTIIPVINQPTNTPPALCDPAGCNSTFGLGDVQEQLYFAPKTKPGALIWGAGPIMTFPAATPDTLGAGKWDLGLDAVALVMPGPWVIGILANQQWSVAGNGARPATNTFFTQPFVNYNFGKGWAIVSAPSITANWNAPGDQKWTVPLGAGIIKTFKLGDQPQQLQLAYYGNVTKPTYAANGTWRLVWALLYPIKRGQPPRP
jgi:hypothetical protein